MPISILGEERCPPHKRKDQKVKSMKAHHEIYKNERYEIEKKGITDKRSYSYSINPSSHPIRQAHLYVNLFHLDIYAYSLEGSRMRIKITGSGTGIWHVTPRACDMTKKSLGE